MTGFDRAQAAYDNATPEYLEDEWRYPCCEHCVDHDWRSTKSKHIVPCSWCERCCERCGPDRFYDDPSPSALSAGVHRGFLVELPIGVDWCDVCGDQAVCPECKGT